jgi:hypothetical protein
VLTKAEAVIAEAEAKKRADATAVYFIVKDMDNVCSTNAGR